MCFLGVEIYLTQNVLINILDSKVTLKEKFNWDILYERMLDNKYLKQFFLYSWIHKIMEES